MKTLAILGSTGSVGESTLRVVDLYPDRFQVGALAAGCNGRRLLEQVRRYRPRVVAVHDPQAARDLRRQVQSVEVLEGVEGVSQVAALDDCDIVVAAISGFSGLLPTYRAVRAGKQVALANKETLVAAGAFIQAACRRSGASLVPVDSEHNALHQCLRVSSSLREVDRLVLTASGGPFLRRAPETFREITKAEALAHPTWQMGPKITVDSATMMNKGLEVIEAHHLFEIDASRISIAVHPQSVIHSMVEFIDGTFIAQMSITDMKSAILYALSYPQRWETRLPRMDLFSLPSLEFLPPDPERFPSIRLAYEALEKGDTFPTALNAANEIAVEAFLADRILFSQIPEVCARVLDRHVAEPITEIEVVLAADLQTRVQARETIENL